MRAIRHVLPRSALVDTPHNAADRGIDLVVAGQPLRVEWIGEGSLGRVRRLLLTLPDMPTIVVARHLSDGAREALATAGVGWVDETGAAEIATAHLVISRDGVPDHRPDLLNRWTDAAIAVAEALLCGIRPTVASTQQATGLSTGSCTNALRFLTAEGLLHAGASRGRNSARSITDVDQLLETYATATRSKPNALQLSIGTVGRDPIAELADISTRWDKDDIAWAATGLAAAAVMAPFVSRVSATTVYVDAATRLDLEAVAEAARSRPIEGGRLTLRPFPTVTTNRLATAVDNLRVAPWPRVFTDLQVLGVRGEEAAEHLRATVAPA